MSASADAVSGKSFAALLKTGDKGTVTGIPDGETWQPVSGHHNYAKIVSGPRKGMYINLSMSKRHGEVFKLEHRGGKAVHVYEDGSVVVAHTEHHHGPSTRRAADQPPKGEVWAPVPGTTAWADILGGPRDGLYVNTSGNCRDGMAFQIVHRHGKTFHMYGSGHHRLLVEVRTPHEHEHGTTPATTAPTAPTTPGGVTSPAR